MSVDDIRYLWSFATFLIVAFIIGGRTELLRMEAAAARVRERSTRALYHFSREIAAITDLKNDSPGNGQTGCRSNQPGSGSSASWTKTTG